MRNIDLEQKQYEDIFKLDQKYKINVSEPTDMMLRDIEVYEDPENLDDWVDYLVSLNGTYIEVDGISIDPFSEIPYVISGRSAYGIPFDCFEEYQVMYNNPSLLPNIEDSVDVDFF